MGREFFKNSTTQPSIEPKSEAKALRDQLKGALKKPKLKIPRIGERDREGSKLDAIMAGLRARKKPGPESEPEAEAGELEAEVEDDTNAANNIRRKLWRMGEALKHLKAKGVDLSMDRVGSAICWLSGPDKAAGRACFVECFGEAEGGKAWAAGFPSISGSVHLGRVGWHCGWRCNANHLRGRWFRGAGKEAEH